MMQTTIFTGSWHGFALRKGLLGKSFALMSILDVGCCILAALLLSLLAFVAELLRQLWPILARLDAEPLASTNLSHKRVHHVTAFQERSQESVEVDWCGLAASTLRVNASFRKRWCADQGQS